MQILEEALAGLVSNEIPGALVFVVRHLRFFFDLTNDIARERGLSLI